MIGSPSLPSIDHSPGITAASRSRRSTFPTRYHDIVPRHDVVIFGGGGAGLWLLDALRTQGYRCVLLEADRLGQGQTACCQGIIHGGLKYTLDGVLSGSAAAIRDMPALWRDCLAGRRSPDLGRTRVRAQHCFLWRTESFRSRLGMIGARIGLRVTPRTVRATDRPAVLAACPGTVACVAEQVIDPISLLADLARRHTDAILKIDAEEGLTLSLDEPGQVSAIELTAPGGGPERRLDPRTVVFAAGAGNEALCDAAGVPQVGRQQRRPLHMLMMRGDLPQLNGHCVDGGGTRVTITADTDTAGRTVWQVGGEVSERGVEMEQPSFLAHAAAEIRSVLPDLDLGGVEWSSYRIDRAEAESSGRRPDDVSVADAGNVFACWPTKLALVPRLAQRIAARLESAEAAPSRGAGPEFDEWPRPEVALAPWEMQQQWSTDV
jgi:glycerol-3-phosphate dehydrogenase